MGQVVGCRVDGTPLGTHHAPAAFGLQSPQRRQHARAKPAKAGAMGYLIETVFGGYGADLNGLKQQVIAVIAQSSEVPDSGVGQKVSAQLSRRGQSWGSRISALSAQESQTVLSWSNEFSPLTSASVAATASGFSQPSTET